MSVVCQHQSILHNVLGSDVLSIHDQRHSYMLQFATAVRMSPQTFLQHLPTTWTRQRVLTMLMSNCRPHCSSSLSHLSSISSATFVEQSAHQGRQRPTIIGRASTVATLATTVTELCSRACFIASKHGTAGAIHAGPAIVGITCSTVAVSSAAVVFGGATIAIDGTAFSERAVATDHAAMVRPTGAVSRHAGRRTCA
jgi:hypothetical protein